MRQIDADALKYKNLAEVNGRLTYVLTPEEINNAPTVEEQNWRFYYDHGFADAKKKYERPQGEWVKVKEYRMCIDMSGEIATLYKCSECGRMITILPSRLADYPFCHCGADMRKVVKNEQMGKK